MTAYALLLRAATHGRYDPALGSTLELLAELPTRVLNSKPVQRALTALKVNAKAMNAMMSSNGCDSLVGASHI